MLVAAGLINTLGLEIEGAAAFIAIISVVLVVSDDILATTPPFLMLCTFVITRYDSFNEFVALKYWVIPLAVALVFHFAVYRGKVRIGNSFWGAVAVAVAVTLGGAGSITSQEYFNAQSLYYVGGLGVGMVLLYLLLSTQFSRERDYDIREFFASMMYTVAILGVFMVGRHYYVSLPSLLEGTDINMQWSNNISTTFVIAMPFVFFFKKFRFLHLLFGAVILVAAIATGSRGGMMAGAVAYIICSVGGILFDRKNRILNAVFFVLSAVVSGIAVNELWPIISRGFDIDPITGERVFISTGEPRAKLFERMKEDFSSNVLFGRGLGYSGNEDVYDPKKFAMHWYHSAPMQILGSLGLTGAVCYCMQILLRVWSAVVRFDPFKLAVLLSFAGLWTMSLVNPGIFCPLPYEFIAMFMFLIVEMLDGGKTKPIKKKSAKTAEYAVFTD